VRIPINQIDPNPGQPRKRFAGLDELAASIRQHGLLEPIMVRPKDERYQIVHGERRWRACLLAGEAEIEAILREVDDSQAFQISLAENVQRQDLNPIEEAQAFASLQEIGWTQASIAQLIGKSQQYIASRLVLLKLPAAIKEQITTHVVSPSHGEMLAGIKDPALQARLVEQVVKDKLSVKGLYSATATAHHLAGGWGFFQLPEEWVFLTPSRVKVRLCRSPHPGALVEGKLPFEEWKRIMKVLDTWAGDRR